MGFSLDVEDLRICLNEVDEVGQRVKGRCPTKEEGGEDRFPDLILTPSLLFDVPNFIKVLFRMATES